MTSGFLFWLIIATNVASERYGTETYSDLDASSKLQQITSNPKRFRVSFVLLLVEHGAIIALAVVLFVAFSPYNIVLAVVWTVSRAGEGAIQIYNRRNYWRLLEVATEYSRATGMEKESLGNLAGGILVSKNSSFTIAQILFSIGTLGYSIFFLTSGAVPSVFGWSGIVAASLYGFGNGLMIAKPNVGVVWKVGGLLILLFEVALGGWLLFAPLVA